MSLTRKVKYSNLLAVRTLKRNVTAENLEKLGYLALSLAVFFGFTTSFSALV